MKRIMYAILSILDKRQGHACSSDIASDLAGQGIAISERTARYYLKMLDEEGLTVNSTKRSRMITEKGRRELRQGFVSDRVGFIISKINNLSVLMDFNPETVKGKVILNITYVPEDKVTEALDVLEYTFSSPYALSDRVVIAQSNELLGDVKVPAGLIGVGTVCSITFSGVFLKSGIPVFPRFGGIVEIENKKPVRFNTFISYDSSSVAPLEIFIKSRMTEILPALDTGNGNILGSFREIPENCVLDAKRLIHKLTKCGFKDTIIFGKPGNPLLGIPVAVGRVGLVVLGGLNPNAALEEAGLSRDIQAMATLYEYMDLKPIHEYRKQYPLRYARGAML